MVGIIMRSKSLLTFALCAAALTGSAVGGGIIPNEADALAIGKRVWKNECAGTVEGLTSWNSGEDFASLGIGHFIWYPKGKRGPFEESFPHLMQFLQAEGTKVPGFAKGPCVWNSKREFEAARDGAQMTELRTLLKNTIPQQARFLVMRLDAALPKMLAEAKPAHRDAVQKNFTALTQTRAGCYALIDYVNFKGEGTAPGERYQGQGWGLLQVLEGMRGQPEGAAAVADFSRSAGETLTRRVKNSPPERKESRWLTGWLARVNAYPAGP
jgi:hypothetical protein